MDPRLYAFIIIYLSIIIAHETVSLALHGTSYPADRSHQKGIQTMEDDNGATVSSSLLLLYEIKTGDLRLYMGGFVFSATSSRFRALSLYDDHDVGGRINTTLLCGKVTLKMFQLLLKIAHTLRSRLAKSKTMFSNCSLSRTDCSHNNVRMCVCGDMCYVYLRKVIVGHCGQRVPFLKVTATIYYTYNNHLIPNCLIIIVQD